MEAIKTTESAQDGFNFTTHVKTRIREFVIENYMFGDGDGLEDKTSFTGYGIVDSTGILELVEFLENEFSIAIADEELVPENLDSIHLVSRFLERKCYGTGITLITL